MPLKQKKSELLFFWLLSKVDCHCIFGLSTHPAYFGHGILILIPNNCPLFNTGSVSTDSFQLKGSVNQKPAISCATILGFIVL